MPDGKVVVEFSSEEYKLLQGMRSVVDQWAKMGDAAGKTRAAAREAAREQEDWGRKARQVWEQTRTPMEQYYQKYKDLNELVRRGKIDQETYARAIQQAGQEYERAGRAGDKAVGHEMLGKVARLTASIAGIGSAISAVKTLWSDMAASAEEAGQKGKTAESGLGLLAQLAIGPTGKVDTQKFAALTRRGREMFAGGATRTLEEAYGLIFQLESAGAMGEADLFERMGRSRLTVDPAAMARSARSLQAAMGKERTGTLKKIIGETFAFSAGTPVTAEELLAASSRAGTFAKMIGVPLHQIMAAVGVTAEASGGFSREEMASAGATQSRALMASLAKIAAGKTGGEDEQSVPIEEAFRGEQPEGQAEPFVDFTGWGGLPQAGQAGKRKVPKFDFRGKDLLGMLEEIEAANLDPAMLLKLFGRKEAVAAYQSILTNREKYRAQVALGAKVQGEKLLDDLVGLEERDASALGARTRRLEEARAEITKEELGTWQNVSEGILLGKERAWREEGGSRLLGAVGNRLGRMVRGIVGPERFVRWTAPTATGELAVAADKLMLESDKRERREDPLGPAATRLLEAGDKLGRVADEMMRQYQPSPTMAGRDF